MSLRKLYQTTYQDRLSDKPVQDGWKDIKELKDFLFRNRLQLSSKIISKDWDISHITEVCSKLKSGKARDRDDLIYELFNPAVCCDDMTFHWRKCLIGLKGFRHSSVRAESSNNQFVQK